MYNQLSAATAVARMSNSFLNVRPPPSPLGNLPLLMNQAPKLSQVGRATLPPVMPSTAGNARSSRGGYESNKSFCCEKCGRSYTSVGNLKRHKKYECGVEPKFNCPVCQKKFQHRHSVKIHITSAHTKEFHDMNYLSALSSQSQNDQPDQTPVTPGPCSREGREGEAMYPVASENALNK